MDSLAEQKHADWSLFASDDGSIYDTLDILTRFGRSGHPVNVLVGPQKGAGENFMDLIRQTPTDVGWLAFCDQDDVWQPDRLARGITALQDLPVDVPALYCARRWVTNKDLGQAHLSSRPNRPASFQNALVQNIASGNTILLNRAGAQLVRQAAQLSGPVVIHDWWIYQVITGCGGVVIFDDVPTVLYRQHGDNVIGANTGFRAKLSRLKQLVAGRYQDWTSTNISALTQVAHLLTPENRRQLEQFACLRKTALWQRVPRFHELGLYRQNILGTAALWTALVFGRL